MNEGGKEGGREGGRRKVPEVSLGADTEVLEDEPYSHCVVWVGQFECADA